MTFLTTTASNSGILPSEHAELITKPLTEQALAFNPALATTLTSEFHDIILPSIEKDVAAEWVREGEEISLDSPTMSETTLAFHKVAGLTAVSTEMAEDSQPQAAAIVGQSIARSLINKVNTAFLGDLAAPAPKGLESITENNVVAHSGRTTIENLDPFASAISLSISGGHQITGWIMNPMDALTIATLKESEGSNKRLTDSISTIEELPVFQHPAVPKGTAWGLDASGVYTGLRQDVTIVTGDQAYFTSDRLAIRATARIGFAFPDPRAVTRIELYNTTP